MKKRNILIQTIVLLACLLLYAPSVSAHATPLSYSPDASSVLTGMPKEISIGFSEHIEEKASSIIVYGPNGERADQNNTSTDKSDTRFFQVSVNDRGQGTYTVSWQVVSADDGHFTQGAYVFSVGSVSANPQAQSTSFQINHSSSIPEGLTIGAELVGEALLLGLLVMIAFIWRPFRKKHFVNALEQEEDGFTKRIGWIIIACFILAAGGAIAYFVFKTNELKNLQQVAFAQAFWAFFTTLSARYTLYRLITVTVLSFTFLFSLKKILAREKLTKTEIFLFACLAIIDLMRARVSHAAASNFYPAMSVIINGIHLLFKDLWVGGALALLILWAPIIKKLKNLPLMANVLLAFSRISIVALAVGGVTGVYVVWLHLKDFGAAFTTDWGRLFIILSVFAGGLFTMRMLQQLWILPKIIRSLKSNKPNDLKKPLMILKWALPFEAITGIFILLVTAVLIITTPPLSLHYGFGRSAISQGIKIDLTQDAYENSKFLVTFTDEKTGKLSSVNELVISLSNPEKNIGPISAPLEQRFVGGYVFEQNLLSPAGNWKVAITGQRSGAYDAVADFAVNYPDEIISSSTHAQDRHFGLFEIANIFMAIALLFLAYLLNRQTKKLQIQILAESKSSDVPTALSAPFSWLPPLIIASLIFILLGGAFGVRLRLIESSFQKLCEKNQAQTYFMWHESAPERAGKATSDLAVPGCMVGIGQGAYHFADEREFIYFTRPAEVEARLQTSDSLTAGKPAVLTFSLKDYDGDPVTDLSLDHNRILHTVIVSQDFSVFSHVHVEDTQAVTLEMLKSGQFPVAYTFPKAGKYLVAVDFTIRARPFSESFYVDVSGPALESQVADDFALNKNFGDYNVSLGLSSAGPKAGQPITLNYHITQNQKPVLNLEPYLAVPMHISVVREDLQKYVHIHGLLPQSLGDKILGTGIHTQHLFLPQSFGPDITAFLSFPSAGVYHIFGEFKHNGKVVPTDFMVLVE